MMSLVCSRDGYIIKRTETIFSQSRDQVNNSQLTSLVNVDFNITRSRQAEKIEGI